MHTTLKSAVVACASVLSSAAMAASELELAIGSDLLSVDYYSIDDVRGGMWGVGAIHNDSNNATAVAASFNAVGEATAERHLLTGLGLKAVVHETFQTAGSLALGGLARYAPPGLGGFGLEAQLYYAPEILNSNDAEQYHEIIARLTYALNPSARMFAGWTDKSVQYDAPVREVEIANAVNVGFVLTF